MQGEEEDKNKNILIKRYLCGLSETGYPICIAAVFVICPSLASLLLSLSTHTLSLSSHNRENHLLNFPIPLFLQNLSSFQNIHGIQSSMRFLIFKPWHLLLLPCQVLKPSSPIFSVHVFSFRFQYNV